MNKPIFRNSLIGAIPLALVALLIAGCGGDANPMGPSLPTNANAVFGTSAISGQLLGGGGLSASAAFGGAPRSSAMSGVQVSIDGTSTATSTDSGGRFVLVGVPSGTVNLRINGGGNNANLAVQGVGSNEHVQLTIQVSTGSATVVGERRHVLEAFSGMVNGVDTGILGFTLAEGPTILTDENTWWDTGGDLQSFAELARAFADGNSIKVEGRLAPTPGGSTLATVVKAELGFFDVADLRLAFSRDKWSLGWIGSGNSGSGNSAIEAYVSRGPFADILPESVEMEGPDGTVVPFATLFESGVFVARFTKPQAISVTAGAVAGSVVEVTVRGTLVDGTPWELFANIEVVDDDDDDDEDDGEGGDLDPAVAAQAIADIRVVIDYINELVAEGDMASNSAKPLITSLESTIGSLEKLNGTPSINKLQSFLNKLDSSEKTGKIFPEDAEFIEGLVNEIIELLRGAI